ncbi:hypothetical protein [Sphingomonas sp.]|jgi:heme/copper-type cytochrome/quinol oxidase subunit 2|uniref:hypothetical protein n=1 Tax=Sphingomonas sp. TaxID=28214 RepID=UPI002D80CB56|nr:hypothetical protein [Sphingomonas sp.]HEU0045188.1 hypothetical protein [Sphingomonas sp.]
MKRSIVALAGSVLTAIYWWVAFAVVYADALFRGDRNPASPPAPDSATIGTNLAVIVIAILLYAALSLAWRRLTARFFA